MSFLGLHASDTPAVIEAGSGEVTTYRQLIERSTRVAEALGPRKALVALLLRNELPSVSAYAATQLAGHAVALLDGSRPLAAHEALLHAYRPEFVAGPPGTGETLRGLGLPLRAVDEVEGIELARIEGSGDAALHPALAVLLATSGTTGSSKSVRLTQANVEANAGSIVRYIGLAPGERAITALPLHYSFGLSILNSHWLAGATVVLTTESVMQRTFWQAVRELDCTSLAGVPYTYQMLERVGYRDMELPALRTMQQAGGALDRTLIGHYAEHMRRKGGRLFVMYGQTEATARIAYVPPERLPDKVGSAGIAIPGGRLHIEQGVPAGPGGRLVGEVVYEGPNVMLGYAEGRDDLARGDELGGVLHTGDIGYLDEEGFLYLTGRSKRIAKVFGLRLNLDEVEALLRESGPAAVVAGEDVIWGFCAFGSEASVLELRASLSRRLRLHPSAIELRHVGDIPVSSSGKIDYQQVESWTRR